jgi:hypothetical protein
MDDNRRRVMYDGFNSVTLGHSKEWVRVAKQFVDLAFSGGPRVVKCPCTKCQKDRRTGASPLQEWVYA